MKFRKKPVEIEAMQWDGTIKNYIEILEWAKDSDGVDAVNIRQFEDGESDTDHLIVHTLEGAMRAAPNDYIIRGVQGEFYPCKPDIFAATYIEVPVEPGYGDVNPELTAVISRTIREGNAAAVSNTDIARNIARAVGEHLEASVRGTETAMRAWETIREECGL